VVRDQDIERVGAEHGLLERDRTLQGGSRLFVFAEPRVDNARAGSFLAKPKPTEQGLPGAHFSDPKNPGNAIRIHAPDPKAPPGTNSSSGWTLRVVKNGNYYDDHGRNLTKDLGGKAARQADVGHIPLAGNSRLASSKPSTPTVPLLSGGSDTSGLPQGSPRPSGSPHTPKVNSSAESTHPTKSPTAAETGAAGETPISKVGTSVESTHPTKPATTAETGATGVKAPGISKMAEGAAENTSTLNRLLRGFENGMKTFFSPKVQVPLAVALELLVLVDSMDMASGGLSGEGFILREEIKKSIQIENEASSLRNWYEGYHDDLASAVTQANLLMMTKGSAEARGTLRKQAGEIRGPLRARAGEVDTLLRKVSAIHREAEQKAGVAEKLLNSKEFAALTAPMGTVVLANVFAAMQDLTRISGYTLSAESDLTKLKQLVQDDILIMEAYR
jgi:Bacterial toxin 30